MLNDFSWGLYSTPYIAHYGKGHDDNPPGRGSGRYPYGSGAKGLARGKYEEAKKHVGTITNVVKFAAKESGSYMYGLQNRLKTESSIERKINKKVIEDGLKEEEAAANMKDAIRFTTISRDYNFVHNYKKFKKVMGDLGYEETRCKNYFEAFKRGEVKHKAVQCNYKTPDGYEFEVQFHTPESQDVKNKKVPLYEEIRQVGISQKRALEIEAEMERLSQSIPYPHSIEKIKDH